MVQVPGWASLLIFLFVLWLLGVMEGLQIALVELKRYRHINSTTLIYKKSFTHTMSTFQAES